MTVAAQLDRVLERLYVTFASADGEKGQRLGGLVQARV